MKLAISRSRLLAGAALGFGLALVPTQAQADCVVSPAATPVTGTVTCADTTTTDTTYAGVSPADDRNYEVDTSAGDVTGTVSAGATVDGFGLAFTNTVGGANDLIVVNDGTIQVDAGNVATAGGSGALNINAIGATNIVYSGAGDILNLGTAGSGTWFNHTGTGNITATFGGDVTGSTNFTGIYADHIGTAGNVDITTSTGTTVSAGYTGIWVETGAALAGDISITNEADIVSIAADTLERGIVGEHNGLGNNTVANNGTIGSDLDRMLEHGILAVNSNAASTGNLTVTGTGDIFSAATGIEATNAGTGDLTINYTGAVDTTGALGVDVNSTNGGAVDVTLGAVTATGGVAVDIDQTLAAGTGDVTLNTTGDLAASTTAVDIDNAGTGAVTVNVDGSIAADAGDAVNVSSTNVAAGAIDITTLAGETLAVSGGDGIEVDTAGSGDTTVTNAADITSGAGGVGTLEDGISVESSGTGSIAVDNTGTIGADGDAASSDGILAVISNAASAGNVSVTGSGDIFAVDEGIEIRTAGTGTVTVDYTGAITSDTGEAIEATSTTGALSVTTGDGAITTTAQDAIATVTTTGATTIVTGAGAVTGNLDGINAFSTSGTIDITAGGVVTAETGSGIQTTTTGLTTITVGAAGDVTGATEAILIAGTGEADITNAGTIGDDSATLAINAAAAGDTTVTNQASGVINGTMTFGAGADVLTNLGDINTEGTTDFGAGIDDFSNEAGGAFNLTGDTTLANLETFSNDGLIDLGTFTLTGPAIAFVNTGTIDTDGDAAVAGFTTFDNDGVLDLGPGTFTVIAGVPFNNTGTILADEGVSAITGQTVFNNSGTIDMQDGAANDELTIDSDFVGSGDSTLLVDFTGSVSDLLVINGDASGETAIGAAYLGGGLNLDGVLVVDAITADTDAFVLGAVTGETPLVDVSLIQDGAEFYLIAAPTAAAFNPLVVPGFATDLWYQSADEIFAETVKPATTTGISFWGEGYYSRDKYGDDNDSVVVDGVEFDIDNERKTKRYGAQLGVDYGFGGGRVGLTGGYAWADANGNADADLKAKGWNIGVYGQFGGLTGFHGEFLAKHDRYDAEFDNGAFDGEEFDIRSTGFDGSVGYRFGMGGAATFDIHGGLSHVRTKVDDISAFGFNYDIEKLTSTRGRLGARAIFGGSLSPYIDGTVYREFDGDGEVELFDGLTTYDFDTEGKGTWARLEAGLSGNDGPGPILAAWGDFGDRKGFGLRAGWRLGGAAVVEAPPPPPPAPYVAPPAPPPPATQTCPDGSVILATDACPPPPPPPPPAPEPERG